MYRDYFNREQEISWGGNFATLENLKAPTASRPRPRASPCSVQSRKDLHIPLPTESSIGSQHLKESAVPNTCPVPTECSAMFTALPTPPQISRGDNFAPFLEDGFYPRSPPRPNLSPPVCPPPCPARCTGLAGQCQIQGIDAPLGAVNGWKCPRESTQRAASWTDRKLPLPIGVGLGGRGGGSQPPPPPGCGIRMRVHNPYRQAQSRSAKQKSKRKALQ